MIHTTQGLVMDPAIKVPLQLQIVPGILFTETLPVVIGKHEIHAITKDIQCFLDVFTPDKGVSHLSATERQCVMQSMCTVLGDTKRAMIREEKIHFCRRFRTRCILENDFDAINIQLGASKRNLLGGTDKITLSQGN